MTQDTPSRSLDKVIVRLPDGMRDRIREAAEHNNRSMNAEIVSTLEEKYPPYEFKFAEFMRNFVEPIVAAYTVEEKQRLMAIANKTACAFFKGLEVRLDPETLEVGIIVRDAGALKPTPTKADE